MINAKTLKTISLPAPNSALPKLSEILNLLLRWSPTYPRMWLDLLEKYAVNGSFDAKKNFHRSVVRYLGPKAMLEVVKEYWIACK